MWCKNCFHETNSDICELCNAETDPVIPTEIYWCSHCNIPIIKEINDNTKDLCPICGLRTSYMSADLRPVFPEERLLIEILLDELLKYVKSSVWANTNRYYFNGNSKVITSKHYKKYSPEYITEKLKEYSPQNSYDSFNQYIELFESANQIRLNTIIHEAHEFIKNEASISFLTSLILLSLQKMISTEKFGSMSL